jgi:hypothetical protein
MRPLLLSGEAMNEKIAAAKKWVEDHKTPIMLSALTVTSTLVVIQHMGIKSLNQFLKDNDLYEQYYLINEEF